MNKFKVNDIVSIDCYGKKFATITDVINLINIDDDIKNKYVRIQWVNSDVSQIAFSKDLTLVCNEERNCNTCKRKLNCITEGVK